MMVAILLLSGCIREVETDSLMTKTFEECEEEGGIVMEMYPRQCRDQQGNVYVEMDTEKQEAEASESGSVCVDNCGNGVCEEVVCLAIGCPCAETAISCPVDCGSNEGLE